MFKNIKRYVVAKKQARNLVILTSLYFIIEIIVNFSVYRQLSISSDRFTAETMEFWGKGIAGVGIGLIWTRFLLIYSKKEYKTYRAFLSVCLITVPLSFVLQTAFIDYVVEKSTPEDRNKAVLITATHGALVPFFGIDHWSKKFDISTKEKVIYPFFKWMTYRHDTYRSSLLDSLRVTKPCALNMAESTGITKGVDKAFFPYISLIKDIDEVAYKKIIEDYYLCTYQDEEYFRAYSVGKVNQEKLIGDIHYKNFMPAVDRYNEYKKYENNLKEAKKVADKAWRKGMDEMFGFKTTIKPDRWPAYFYNHPDVRRMYEEKTGLKDLHPTDKDFREKATKFIKKNLPESAIPAYKDVSGEASEQYKKLTDDEITDQGKKAYKAIVMPMIAIGLSAFFLMVNLTLVLNSYLSRRFLNKAWVGFQRRFLNDAYRDVIAKITASNFIRAMQKKLKIKVAARGTYEEYELFYFVSRNLSDLLQFLIRKSFLILAFIWLFILPFMLSGGAYDDLENAKYKNTMKWVYFNESTLISVYDVFIGPVNKATSYIFTTTDEKYIAYKESVRHKEQERIEKMIEDGGSIFYNSER